ncbi:MAG: hypothetical protein M3139_05765 [Bacteroidota bacterium]|nr:hypothetical protein [Bacteroidota bacterium]
MKIKLSFALIIAMFALNVATAQQHKIHFNSKNNIGISIGQKDIAPLLQTINGISFNKYFFGVGVGIDNYNYKSYPLFIHVRRYFGKDDNVFFFGDLGYNLSGKNKPGKEMGYYTAYDFSGGIYSDFGIGYRTRFINRSFFTVSAGFTYKEMANKISVMNECFAAPCTVDYSKYKYGNGRVALKAGIDF